MATQESTLIDDKFSTPGSIIVGNNTSTCNNPCVPSRDYSTNQLGGWGLTLSKFSPHNVKCKKDEK